MTKTAIEWTEQTWNPVAGCSWASPGCDHCYAATMTRRLEAMGQTAYAGLTTHKHFNGVLRPLPDKLDVPLRRRKPTMWFVNSMSDLFHPKVPFEFIDQIFAVMALCPQHTFQVLTKRPERMAEYCATIEEKPNERESHDCPRWSLAPRIGHLAAKMAESYRRNVPLSHAIAPVYDRLRYPFRNVWLGTSVENQERADERIPHLLKTPATVRFLSCEPLLGAVDLTEHLPRWYLECERCGYVGESDERPGNPCGSEDADDGNCQGNLRVSRGAAELHWVIAGGESGPGARPMHPDWARGLRDQCQAAGVPFFFKQWGEYCHWSQTTDDIAAARGAHPDGPIRLGKKAAGRLLDGRKWNEMPEVNRA